MQGILKVGRDFFVYFDSKMGLVRRMERNDVYKMLRLCDRILIVAIKLKSFDQTDTKILLTWEAEEYGDQEIEELKKKTIRPRYGMKTIFLGGGVR